MVYEQTGTAPAEQRFGAFCRCDQLRFDKQLQVGLFGLALQKGRLSEPYIPTRLSEYAIRLRGITGESRATLAAHEISALKRIEEKIGGSSL